MWGGYIPGETRLRRMSPMGATEIKLLDEDDEVLLRRCVMTFMGLTAFFMVFSVGLFLFDSDTVSGWIVDSDEYMPVVAKQKIISDNRNVIMFKNAWELRHAMRKNNITNDLLKKESVALGMYVDQLKQTPDPSFNYVPNSTGIVISCLLEQMCLSNLMYMLDYANVDVPVELWLEKTDPSLIIVKRMIAKWGPRLRVKYFEDINDKYIETFGPIIRYDRPYRLFILFILLMPVVVQCLSFSFIHLLFFHV